MRRDLWKKALLPLIVLLLSGLVFFPMFAVQVAKYDYLMHIRAANLLLTSGTLTSSHFLYQLLVIMFQELPGIGWTLAGQLAVLFTTMATTLLIYWAGRQCGLTGIRAAVAALALTLVTPLTLLFPWDRLMYMGYIGITVYHNPTIWLLKPFAIGIFLMLLHVCRPDHQPRLWEGAALATLVILSALAKPNLMIALLPALALFVAFDWQAQRRLVPTLSLGVFLPGCAVLAWQYFLTYSAEQVGFYSGSSTIIFAPLQVMSHYSRWLLPKALLSIAFPLAVLIAYGREAFADRGIRFAWLLFVVGASYGYLLAESGPRKFQANFLWSGQITLFLLFFCSLLFVLSPRTPLGRRSRARLICLTVFVMHLINGIVFYGLEYFYPEKYLGWG